jgi:hypothetical protein
MLNPELTTKIAEQLTLNCENCPDKNTGKNENCQLCIVVQAFKKLPKKEQLAILAEN